MATKAPREIWTTVTAKGAKRYWYYSTLAGRALPVAKAVAELELAMGFAVEGTKPEWVGK
jgi:hypothetical protein